MPRRLAITSRYQARVLSYDDPSLKPGEVLVRTEIASGKHGTTMGIFDGRNFRGFAFDESMRLFLREEEKNELSGPLIERPQNAGTSGVGTVVALGPAVTRWKVGDRVFGLMDTRETNVCREDWLWPLGEIDPELALCVEPAYVAFHSIRESNMRLGDKVAIIGLGAIGLIAVRLARAAGAEQVLVSDPLPLRRELAISYGATEALDPQSGDMGWQVRKLTGGAGVDVAIEAAGRYEALRDAIRSTRLCGTICSAGFYQGEAQALWLGQEWHHNRLTMVVPHGCGWGHLPRDYPRWDEKRAYDTIVSLMRQGILQVPGLIQPVMSLEEAPDVFRLMRDDPGRVVKFAVRFA